MIIIIFGLPGSGKSYFAKNLAKKLNIAHFNSDIIRKTLFPKPDYTPAEKEQIYDFLLDKLNSSIENKEAIIIDATFSGKNRDVFIARTSENPNEIFWIEIKASEQTIRERLAKPRPDSDANYMVFEALKEEWQPLPIEHLTIFSDEYPISEMIQQALKYLDLND
jgi:predicted kinase